MGKPGGATGEWRPPDVVTTLADFLQRRFENGQALKEKEKEKLTEDDYQLLREELNNTEFLAPLDADNCIGNEGLPFKERTCSFCRASIMMNHVEDFHLRNQSVRR